MPRIPFFVFTPLLALFLVFSAAPPAAAEEGGMLVTPQRLVFENNKRTESFMLANRASTTKRFRISLINRTMKEDGSIVDTKDPAPGEAFADQYLRIAPRSVTIGSNQSQTVRVMSRLPANAPEGEYRSHILFEEVAIPPDASAAVPDRSPGIRIETRVSFAMPIIIRKGKLSAHVTMANPRIERAASGAPVLYLDLLRDGNRSTLGNLTVYDAKNTLVGTLNAVGVYLSVSKRVARVPLSGAAASGARFTVKYQPTDNSPTPTNDLTFTAP